MRVCHCHAVTDRDIRSAVRSGACSVESVGRACGAGTSCGGCVPLVASVIRSEVERFAPSNERGLRILLPERVAG